MKPSPKARLRCAIYTRKSSEEGLEQGFNSLHAQREACDAYVLSQAGEGWTAIATTYDDGGFSGGSMDRPGLKTLLADIDLGRIDVVVVYKVDSLTRSLADFAKIVEAFDDRGVLFVSVTQAFNTTTSMGRLTLNVLLSFAQFEREVTGERIRDKLAASKKKGMWMGGVPPLGCDRPTDLLTRALVVNVPEAQTVRLIFRRYLELGSVHVLQRWLADEGLRSKQWVSTKGVTKGGLPINRGALFHLLKNRIYLGEIPHKLECYPGAHAAIVDAALFDEVQASLARVVRGRVERPTRVSTMALKGLIFDGEGHPMSPAFTHRGKGRIYRYYVSAPLQQGERRQGDDDETLRRVSAPAIEEVAIETLKTLSGKDRPDLRRLLARIDLHARTVQLVVRRPVLFKTLGDPDAELRTLERRLAPGQNLGAEAGGANLRLTLDCRMKVRGGRTVFISETGAQAPMRSRPDRNLIRALKLAHSLVAQAGAGPLGAIEALRIETAPTNPYRRTLMRLAFLAPDLQDAILAGTQAPALNLQRLIESDLPPSWQDQRAAFGA